VHHSFLSSSVVKEVARFGGDVSHMSPEATKAKRESLAASLRSGAAKEQGTGKMLKLMESLVYAPDAAALAAPAALLSHNRCNSGLVSLR
jgi:hypothetical protein